jgi:hypothetical protein
MVIPELEDARRPPQLVARKLHLATENLLPVLPHNLNKKCSGRMPAVYDRRRYDLLGYGMIWARQEERFVPVPDWLGRTF